MAKTLDKAQKYGETFARVIKPNKITSKQISR